MISSRLSNTKIKDKSMSYTSSLGFNKDNNKIDKFIAIELHSNFRCKLTQVRPLQRKSTHKHIEIYT